MTLTISDQKCVAGAVKTRALFIIDVLDFRRGHCRCVYILMQPSCDGAGIT